MNEPVIFRKLFDPDDGRVRCWSCKDYVGCGDHYVVVVHAGVTKKLPCIALCTKCASHIAACVRSHDTKH